jgi:chaperonin GroES
MKVVPLRDYVIVKRKTEEKMTAGGLFIPDNAQEKSVEGEVMAVGRGKVLDNGTLLEPRVRMGDKVLMQKNAFIEVKFDGEDYLLIKEEHILAVLNHQD